jgi:signal transduction histidine kinase
VLLLLTGGAYLTVRRLLQPLQPIGAGVAAFGRGDFSKPIAVKRPDELGALAERINGMAANLSGMLDAKRTLLLAISHELRSPLTRARVNTELLEDRPRAPGPAARPGRDGRTDHQPAGKRTPGRRTQRPARRSHRSGRTGAQDAVAALSPPMPVTLRLAAAVAPAPVDPTRLRLLLRNLLENTRRHATAAPQAPELFLRPEADGRLALGVRDFGPGVPEAQLAPMAQAFYRPDSARTREGGGVGLGLYLCRLVAQAHGGELRLRNVAPGLEVAMVWRPPTR